MVHKPVVPPTSIAGGRAGSPEKGQPSGAQQALRALEAHPALPAVIPSLPPGALARLYHAVGMNDAGALMVMAPAGLLARALDAAVWTQVGDEARFDPDVFVDWLEVWLGEGDAFAAERLLALEEDLLALCFSEVVRVEDSHVGAFSRLPDEDEELTGDSGDPGEAAAVFDRFLVVGTAADEWDVVHGALLALWSLEPDHLLTLLERLAACPPAGAGRAGVSLLHQDVAAARESRQEGAGYVPAAAARAFLGFARVTAPAELVTLDAYDPETHRHLRGVRAAASAAPAAPGAGAPANRHHDPDAADSMSPEPAAEPADTAIWSLLAGAGIVTAPAPAGLLAGPGAGPGLTLRQRLEACDADTLAHTAAELAYLANVLLAGIRLPAGEQRRDDRARELAFATANLGVELLESWGLEVILGEPPGLVRAFLVAWRALAELPERLVAAFEAALASPAVTGHLGSRQWLRVQMTESLGDLRDAVSGSRFDAARDAVGLLSLACNTDACRAATHLLAEPPRFPGLLEGGDRHAARWICRQGDLERIRALMDALGQRV